jgi:hypothetical protein
MLVLFNPDLDRYEKGRYIRFPRRPKVQREASHPALAVIRSSKLLLRKAWRALGATLLPQAHRQRVGGGGGS